MRCAGIFDATVNPWPFGSRINVECKTFADWNRCFKSINLVGMVIPLTLLVEKAKTKQQQQQQNSAPGHKNSGLGSSGKKKLEQAAGLLLRKHNREGPNGARSHRIRSSALKGTGFKFCCIKIYLKTKSRPCSRNGAFLG